MTFFLKNKVPNRSGKENLTFIKELEMEGVLHS